MEKHMPRGQWKLGKIVSVEPGIDNKVRRISIAYKHENSNTFITIDRSVQRVVVILPVEEPAEQTGELTEPTEVS